MNGRGAGPVHGCVRVGPFVAGCSVAMLGAGAARAAEPLRFDLAGALGPAWSDGDGGGATPGFQLRGESLVGVTRRLAAGAYTQLGAAHGPEVGVGAFADLRLGAARDLEASWVLAPSAGVSAWRSAAGWAPAWTAGAFLGLRSNGTSAWMQRAGLRLDVRRSLGEHPERAAFAGLQVDFLTLAMAPLVAAFLPTGWGRD